MMWALHSRTTAAAHLGAGHAKLEDEAVTLDARLQRPELVGRQVARAVDDLEQDRLDVGQQVDDDGRCRAARRLAIEPVGLEQVAGPRLL
jgi:lipase chaperone LimK